jgi:hypothetical protein
MNLKRNLKKEILFSSLSLSFLPAGPTSFSARKHPQAVGLFLSSPRTRRRPRLAQLRSPPAQHASPSFSFAGGH